MRVLVAFAGGRGHLLPMLPLARALAAAGHELAVSGHPDSVGTYGVFAEVLPHDRHRPRSPSDGGTGTLEAPDLEHEFEVVGRWYAGELAGRNHDRTVRAVESWGADLLVCDEMDFGTVAAGRRLGLPVAVVDVIASGALARSPYIDDGVAALDLPLDRVKGDLEVCPFPVSFRDPAFPLTDGAAPVRPDPGPVDEPHPAAAWLAEHDGPTAYVTLGTIFNSSSGDLFARVLGALADGPTRVLATVGADVDPDRIDVGAPNVRLERFVPQDQVLPHVDVAVNHGGSGSVIGALAHGVPVVTTALGADQELNARRLVDLGAGVALDALACTGDDVRAAVGLARGDASVRDGARRLRDEIAGLPAPASLVPRLAALASR